MNIPHWLFRLLPMWDYICPKCQKEVPKNSRECPFCSERYPSPLKVPPKLHKDRKALENYVHKHIFPKVSREHREYLTQFFTDLFSDGFESGDFSAWTATSGTPTIVGSPTHHGSYAMNTNGSADYVYKTLASTITKAFYRFYWRTDTAPASGEYAYLASLRPTTWGTACAMVGVWNNAGTITWILTVNGVPHYYTLGSCNPNQWYCIEFEYDADSDSQSLWIDGIKIISATDSATAEIKYITLGISNFFGSNHYYDCVVVADAYIGPESAAALQTVMDSLSLTDYLFRNKKLFVADSVGLQEIPSRNKSLKLLDSLTAEDLIQALKTLNVTDDLALSEVAWTPSRLIQINESVGVVEVAYVGEGGAKKRSYFSSWGIWHCK
jgi:hypothetical protein